MHLHIQYRFIIIVDELDSLAVKVFWPVGGLSFEDHSQRLFPSALTFLPLWSELGLGTRTPRSSTAGTLLNFTIQDRGTHAYAKMASNRVQRLYWFGLGVVFIGLLSVECHLWFNEHRPLPGISQVNVHGFYSCGWWKRDAKLLYLFMSKWTVVQGFSYWIFGDARRSKKFYRKNGILENVFLGLSW